MTLSQKVTKVKYENNFIQISGLKSFALKVKLLLTEKRISK